MCQKVSVRFISAILLSAAVAFVLSPVPGAAQGDAKNAATEKPIIRFKAGAIKPYKDSKGNTWLADEKTKDGGFEGGETIDRADDMKIENTKDPEIYRSERYSMDSFSWKLPNGKYVVKLHFAETYDGIGGPGDRIFSFKVQDKPFKDFDVWKKAGGMQKAYIETVNVDIADGKLLITFTPSVQNPEINGIEIIPAEKADQADKPATGEKSAASK